jgi:CDP-paratose 2-epimerase
MNQPSLGLTEWLRPGDYERVEILIDKAKALHITNLRTAIFWADWYTSEGDGWYAWLLPRLAREFDLLPCFLHTPPSLGIVPKSSSPPRSPKVYADFLDVMITRFGKLFEFLELWGHLNEVSVWDTRMDPDWSIFTEMIGGAAYSIHERGKKVVLPSLWPADHSWFELMAQRGILTFVDAISLSGFPSSSEFGWQGWQKEVGSIRGCLQELGVGSEVWITETGYSTWRGDEQLQVSAFADAAKAPVERVYWRELFDKSANRHVAGPAYLDERDFHYGLLRADGTSKLLYSRWSQYGLKSVLEPARRPAGTSAKRALITGGAGFIGTNLAERLVHEGRKVIVYDSLTRPGVEQNIAWLQSSYPQDIEFVLGDIGDSDSVCHAVSHADEVFHFAAQVAVTTSLINPREDYEVNIGGTLNVLEAIRSADNPPPLIFTSTNKVYGGLTDLSLETNCTRYQLLNSSQRAGISEARPLDFHSPYGCSKGAADQYVLDYARSFHIPALVFRMSCIYGPHQMGTEDQGWIAHFLIRAMRGEPIMICGDGLQVRDVLFVDDLLDAFLLAQANSRTLSGQAFNIGGGLGNTISLLELLKLIETLEGHPPLVRMSEWRAGDQRYYVSDTRKFKAATGWAARVPVREGVRRLHQWLKESRSMQTAQTLEGGRDAILTR